MKKLHCSHQKPYDTISLPILPNFKIVHLGYFFKLIYNLQPMNNVIVKEVSKERYAIAKDMDMARIVGVSLNSFRKFLTVAKKEGVISGVETTQGYGYIVNPAYAFDLDGNGLYVEVYEIFKHNDKFQEMLKEEN